MSLATGLTADEFLARDDWPTGSQLIAGEVIVNQPLLPHQLVLGKLYARVLFWTEPVSGRGLVGLSVDLRLGPTDVYAPDLWWVGEERRPGPDVLRLEGLPDIVAEVRSASTWRFDIGRKRAYYEAAGIPELWLVDTDSRSVLVYRRTSPDQPQFDEATEVADGDALTSPLLPGFSLPLADVVRR
jgi:Uma2 family endonuclease